MRIMLDTNLWSYLGDEHAARQFDQEIVQRNFRVIVPPSTLLEVVRVPKPEVRQRIIEAVGRGPRTRLRTEADYECIELVDEIRRIRPDWLHQVPDASKIASLRAYWTNKVWREALHNSQRIHEYETRRRHNALLDNLVEHQRDARREFLRSDLVMRPLTAITAKPRFTQGGRIYEDVAGIWPYGSVEAWRLILHTPYWYGLTVLAGRAPLTGEDATLADWTGAYVNLAKIRSDPDGFLRLWARDMDLQRMRRNWLRWAVNFVQTGFKVTPGNPADEQHGTYLLDADVYLSADATYIKVLQTVYEDAPFPMAEPRRVSGDQTIPVLDRILAAL